MLPWRTGSILKIQHYSIALFFVFITVLIGCGVRYSPASFFPFPAETIQISNFQNNAELASANLSSSFTSKLKDYYQQNSRLKVVSEKGELQIDGTISNYSITSIAPVAGTDNTSVASLSRLTIIVTANYIDNNEPKNCFKARSFSSYADFPNEQNLSTVQEELEKRIFDQILMDIFNATVANW